MTLWVVRAGKTGDREQQAIDLGYCFVGWTEVNNLKNFSKKEELREELEKIYPDSSSQRNDNHASQLWNFKENIQQGDFVALPLKNTPAIIIGKIIGDYEYKPNNLKYTEHCRKVEWLGQPILRANIDQDLKYSFGSSLTVFRIYRNDAENRILKLLYPSDINVKHISQVVQNEQEQISLIEIASQQISDHIGRHFKGRKMELLIDAILKAKGYETDLCNAGPDGGIDILASGGAMGFSQPFICVQVKSGDSPVGREVLDQLTGVMQRYGATNAILVSWGGFKDSVLKEARRDFFKIRLWNDQKIVEELQETYHLLPKWIQSEISLQKIWVLSEEI